MTKMNRHHLVQAVAELGRSAADGIVWSADVLVWCDRQDPPVDYGPDAGRGNLHLWDSDIDEGRTEHRLLKFKKNRSRGAKVGWALLSGQAEARTRASIDGLVELAWDTKALGNLGNWEWRL